MPNWVSNTLTLRGDETDITAFVEQASAPTAHRNDSDLSFEAFIPVPAAVDYDADWYNWNVQNWGCKWDASSVNRVTIKGEEWSVEYTFNTPWSPPLPFIQHIADRMPWLDITFEYEEEQGWGGKQHWVDSVMESDETWDIPDTHAEWLSRGRDCPACEEVPAERYEDCPGYDEHDFGMDSEEVIDL